MALRDSVAGIHQQSGHLVGRVALSSGRLTGDLC